MSARGALVLVRVVPKEDFKDLKSFANVAMERLKKNMPDVEPKMEDIQVNNQPAIRISMEGTQANGQRKGFLLTFFEINGSYIDVVTTANASVFKSEEPTLAGLAAQVKVSATSEAPAPAATTNPAAKPSGSPPATRSPR